MCFSVLRPYHAECTGSRLITEVKQDWAGLVLGWVFFVCLQPSANVSFSPMSMVPTIDCTSHFHFLSSLCMLPSPVSFVLLSVKI